MQGLQALMHPTQGEVDTPSSVELHVVDARLELGDAAYRPDFIKHTPGVANVLADTLSRKFQPEVRFTVPEPLRNAIEVQPPPRTRSWYLALKAPSAEGSRDANGT